MFSFADAALRGDRVEFIHKGAKVRLVPEQDIDTFDRLTPMQLTSDLDDDIASAKKDVLREIETEWKQYWAEL